MGEPKTYRTPDRLARRARLVQQGVHILRHPFCSHLAMRGAPARAIQELAGHKNLSTTQRYMHLRPAALEGGIRLLDHPPLRLSPPSGRAQTPLQPARTASDTPLEWLWMNLKQWGRLRRGGV